MQWDLVLISVLATTVMTDANQLTSSTTLSQFNGFDDKLQCVARLPMFELLRIQQKIQLLSNATADDTHTTDTDALMPRSDTIERKFLRDKFNPMTASMDSILTPMPFIGGRFRHKFGVAKNKDDSNGRHDAKSMKIQKILHFSITGLAFLAFAGYLLCMIVQAIKSKGTTYYHPALLPMMTTPQTSRPRPLYQFQSNRYRRNTKATPTAEPSPDDLYRALLVVAESYVRLENY